MDIWVITGIPHLEKESRVLGVFTSYLEAELAMSRLRADECTHLNIRHSSTEAEVPVDGK